MHILALVVMFLSTLYCFCMKRTFDFFSIAMISGGFYFSPILPGYAYNPALQSFDPLVNGVYQVTILYYLFLFLGMLINDRYFTQENTVSLSHADFPVNQYASAILLILFLTSFSYLIFSLGLGAFTLHKTELISQLGVVFSLFCTVCLIGVIYWYRQSRYLFLLACIGLIYTLIVGYRFLTILSMLSLLVFICSQRGRQFFIKKNWILVLILPLLLIFFMSGGAIYTFIKFHCVNDFEWASDKLVILHTEPMVIQENLNLIFKKNYHVEQNYLNRNVLLAMLPVSSHFGLKVVGFNAQMQPVLYGNYAYGVASNVWGELYALYGWPGIYTGMLLMSLLCLLMSIQLKGASRNYLSLLIPVGLFLFFYMQRNELTYTVNLIRNIVFIWLLMNIGAYTISRFKCLISAPSHEN